MPYYHMMDWYPYMGFWMSIFWLVILILIAYLIYRLIKKEKVISPSVTSSKSTMDILAGAIRKRRTDTRAVCADERRPQSIVNVWFIRLQTILFN